jgi:hypothetical protein
LPKLFGVCFTDTPRSESEIKREPGMANYMARVELHQAGPADYERLHASMQQRGYVRDMPGEDGAIYRLPAGTYFVTNTSAMLHVALNAAVDAAKEIGMSAAVIVTDWSTARWAGLAESKP